MKVVTWNCQMAFRKKVELILVYKHDILVFPECEHPSKIVFPEGNEPTDVLWYGDNVNKGLGVFSFNEYRLELLNCHNPEIKTILPITVTTNSSSFTMFAVWTGRGYIDQVWKAIRCYEGLITTSGTLIVGDFNSNTIWDKKHRPDTHSSMVQELSLKGIASTYHHYNKLQHGQEEHPTLSMFRHRDKPYHIDYCFATRDFIDKLTNVEVGTYDQWHQYSDHTPLIISFE